jgi:DNA-binding transcriptional regulator YhcF (GntR family)
LNSTSINSKSEKHGMISLSHDEIFETAIKIMLFLERRITVSFVKNSISIRFPTTRKLAEFLNMPHYYVLPHFATMERDNLITRVERVGISTTNKGSKKLIELLSSKYKNEVKQIIDEELLIKLQKHAK